MADRFTVQVTEVFTPGQVQGLIARTVRAHLADLSRELSPAQADALAKMIDSAARNASCALMEVAVLERG